MATVKVVTPGRIDIITKVLGPIWAKFFGDVNDALMISGVGSPVGAVIGDCGDLYTDTSGLAGFVLFVKEDPVNDGTAVGWRAL